MARVTSRRFGLIVILIGAVSAGAEGQSPAGRGASATRLGFAPDRLARIDGFLQRAVDENRPPGSSIGESAV